MSEISAVYDTDELVLVPIELTDDMKVKALVAYTLMTNDTEKGKYIDRVSTVHADMFSSIWKSMLEAAPDTRSLTRRRFLHLKTKGIYELVALSTHTETGIELVTYRNVMTGETWTRDSDMFFNGRFEEIIKTDEESNEAKQ